MTLDERIQAEADPTRKYWLKQARYHFRTAKTHQSKGNQILAKLATYKSGDPLKVSTRPKEFKHWSDDPKNQGIA